MVIDDSFFSHPQAIYEINGQPFDMNVCFRLRIPHEHYFGVRESICESASDYISLDMSGLGGHIGGFGISLVYGRDEGLLSVYNPDAREDLADLLHKIHPAFHGH